MGLIQTIAQNYILSASDYKILFILNNRVSIPILTGLQISMDIGSVSEPIYIAGQTAPAQIKKNSRSYSGTLVMQSGEWAAILAIAGTSNGVTIEDAILAITNLNNIVATSFSRIFNNLMITNENSSFGAKDKSTPVTLRWEAVEIYAPLGFNDK